MRQINTVIDSFLVKTGLSKGVGQQKALEVWEEAVGKKISENTEALSVKHGVLYIKTHSSAWAQELQLKKKEIILKINKKLKKKIIKDLRFM